MFIDTHISLDTGANASAEGGDEGVEDTTETVNNIVYSFRLQPTSFDKKSFMSHLKGMRYLPHLPCP